jgi:hypothetical protein
MTKKHFIALADFLKQYTSGFQRSGEKFTPRQIELLADFCKSQNSNFIRERWLSYIAGECGPNGGAK